MQEHAWSHSAVLSNTTFWNFPANSQHRGDNVTGPVPGYRNYVHTHVWKDDFGAEFAKMREATEFGPAQGEQNGGVITLTT